MFVEATGKTQSCCLLATQETQIQILLWQRNGGWRSCCNHMTLLGVLRAALHHHQVDSATETGRRKIQSWCLLVTQETEIQIPLWQRNGEWSDCCTHMTLLGVTCTYYNITWKASTTETGRRKTWSWCLLATQNTELQIPMTKEWWMERLYSNDSAWCDLQHYTIIQKDSATETGRRKTQSWCLLATQDTQLQIPMTKEQWMERLYSNDSTQSDLHHYSLNPKDRATETWRRDDESERRDV